MPRHLHSRTCCRSTRGCWPAATSRSTEPLDARRGARAASTTPTRDEPFVELVDAPPRHARRARHQPLPDPRDGRAGDGRVLVFCAIDNLWKGAAGQAVQDLNLMLGLPETEGLASDASSARAGSSAPGARRPSSSRPRCRPASAPPGSRPASSRAGLDVGVLVSDEPEHGLGRALHHQRARGRARDRVARGRARRPARRGGQLRLLERRRRRARARHRARPCRQPAARGARHRPGQVGVASTGVIGQRAAARHGARRACAAPCGALGADADELLRGDPDHRQRAQARLPRGARCRAGRCGWPAQAKGAGMISPRFATMFCFVADRRRAGARRRSTCSPACA